MTSFLVKGIPVNFPFEPYAIQKDYMEKVIDCLQNEQNGVLESPTGTGKTLSLLCSSLAWLEVKKAQIQIQRQVAVYSDDKENSYLKSLKDELNSNAGSSDDSRRAFGGLPKIIYASRTHSQLSQAMQELKRTDYKHMKACVLGSRDQMCIHPEVVNEKSSTVKIHMCRLKVKSRGCIYHNRNERKKEDPLVRQMSVMDIEDIVKMGTNLKFCPYYMSKDLKDEADIIFMPYNYLLDPKVRKALGVELSNNVIILDEAHNIERICEDSASLQLKSTDITLCIEEVTAVMKLLSDESLNFLSSDQPKDFDPEELCVLKQILLDFEKTLDNVELKNTTEGGTSFDGNYIFELLELAGIKDNNFNQVRNLIEKIVQFLSTVNEGPFQRKGNGLQLFSDLLTIAFQSVTQEFKQKIQKCYKVHITVEDARKKTADNWLAKATTKRCRVLSYWCFSPGFGYHKPLIICMETEDDENKAHV